MESHERKRVSVISKYILDTFSENDWFTLGQLTGGLDAVQKHGRLLRSLSFGDDDYPYYIAEVLNSIFEKSPGTIDDVIDHFDIDIWYEQKDPRRYKKLFVGNTIDSHAFWQEGCLKAFVSHLSANKQRVTQLKSFLGQWGISAFIAHEDIEPSKEWQREIEAALETMDIMIALVEPGFRDSNWCCQEIGYALGKKVDIVPLRAGLDPFGLFGKYQGIQAKSKLPSQIADELVNLLLRKAKHRSQLLIGLSKSITSLPSDGKIARIRTLDSWAVISDEQMKILLERISLSEYEKKKLSDIIMKVGAFQVHTPELPERDIPF
ncbi:MAG: TIR domain-containing protein [Thermodesulfobacteriota bacterium]